MSEHTPGPWEAAIDDKWIYIGQAGYANYRNAFAKVDYDDVDHDTASADARLIAAAPDLLACLQDFVEGFDPSKEYEGGYLAFTSKANNALAAIAKATG